MFGYSLVCVCKGSRCDSLSSLHSVKDFHTIVVIDPPPNGNTQHMCMYVCMYVAEANHPQLRTEAEAGAEAKIIIVIISPILAMRADQGRP